MKKAIDKRSKYKSGACKLTAEDQAIHNTRAEKYAHAAVNSKKSASGYGFNSFWMFYWSALHDYS